MSSGFNRISNPGVDRLVNLQQEMGVEQHLERTITKPLYTKDNTNQRLSHKATSFRERSKVADAKGNIRNILKDFIGGKAADQILTAKGVRRFQDARVGGDKIGFNIKKCKLSPEGTAITKLKLSELIQMSKSEKLRQVIAAKSPQERLALANKLRTGGSEKLRNDPEVGPLLQLKAEAEFATENLVYLDHFSDLQDQLKTYDETVPKWTAMDGTVHDKENELAHLKNGISDKVADATVLAVDCNISSAALNAIVEGLNPSKEELESNPQLKTISKRELQKNPELARSLIDNMSMEQLKRFSEGALTLAHASLAKNADDTISRLANEVTSHAEIDLTETDLGGAAGEATLNELKEVAQKMTQDDHLRQSGDVIYAKGSHRGGADNKTKTKFNRGKTHFWQAFGNTNRAKKFAAAKQTVLTTITKSMGDAEAAAKIMKPFLSNDKALTKADLTRIISAAESFSQMKGKVDNLVRGDKPDLPQLSQLAKGQPDAWTDAFSDFCDMKGSKSLAQVKQIGDLEFSMREMSLDLGHVSDEQAMDSFNDVKSQVNAMLRRKDLPKGDLRTQLEAFAKLEQPPSSNLEKRNMTNMLMLLSQFRATTTSPDSEVGKLHAEFGSIVDQIKSPQKQIQVFGGVANVPLVDSGSDAASDFGGINDMNIDAGLAMRMAEINNAIPENIDDTSSIAKDDVDVNLAPMDQQSQQVRGPSGPNAQPIDPYGVISRGESIRQELNNHAFNGIVIDPVAYAEIDNMIQWAEDAQDGNKPQLAQDMIAAARTMAESAVSKAINSDRKFDSV